MTFAINAKYVLLTYAQCGDLDGFAVMDRISELGGECIVARETHADGGTHLHVFCDFGRKFRSRKTDVFDVLGYHPNIEPSRGTPEKGYDYAIKDGDVICGGLARPTTSRTGDSSANSKWTEITSATNRDEFWELVHLLDPKSAACSFGQLQKYCDWKFAVAPPTYTSPTGVEFDDGSIDGRLDWLQQSGVGSGQPLLGKISCTSLRGVPLGGTPSLRGDPLPSLTPSLARVRV
ncbi:RepA [Faeces associated gemycircularvirus 21]|uniref:RepA n=2 Tax=Lama associated gemycircularvirus 1 TaxID=1985385 RepID=A0A161I5N4_9VIRU|nr:RepA [Lama associated gemycircularvirus 1]ANC51585.1 RepA [Lama associated gemycircularvirus 1]ANC51591.1 RepA [Faeces associated gemycircularvirus 21]